MSYKSRRHRSPTPMRLTARDKRVLEAVYEHRILSQQQIRRLIFPTNHPSIAQNRLRLLFDNGYLQRRFVPRVGGILTSPILYLLDERGSEVLLKEGEYDEVRWQKSDNRVGYEHLEHLLAINTFRVELALACQADAELSLETWVDDTTLKTDYDRVSITGISDPVAVIPDGYFVLEAERGRTHYFIEMDRGTMTLKRFKLKAEAYRVYHQSRALKKRFGIGRFRLLVITESPIRTQHLKEAIETLDGKNIFWFGTLSDLTTITLLREPVWMVAQRTEQLPLWV